MNFRMFFSSFRRIHVIHILNVYCLFSTKKHAGTQQQSGKKVAAAN